MTWGISFNHQGFMHAVRLQGEKKIIMKRAAFNIQGVSTVTTASYEVTLDVLYNYTIIQCSGLSDDCNVSEVKCRRRVGRG